MNRLHEALKAIGVLPLSVDELVDRYKKIIRTCMVTKGAITLLIDDDAALHIVAHLITKDGWDRPRAAIVAIQGEADVSLVEEKARARCDGKCLEVKL